MIDLRKQLRRAEVLRRRKPEIEECAPCRAKAFAKMKAASELISVVIPAIDEDPAEIRQTLSSTEAGTEDPLELILIDDCSKIPITGATIRNEKRLGATRSRKRGCTLAKGHYVAILDSHMKIVPGALRRLATIAQITHGIAYCGCNAHQACALRNINGLPVSKWIVLPSMELTLTDSMMGACYVMERTVLESMGGWIGLPGWQGWQECAMSILAWKCAVPITCDPKIVNWHHFRERPSAPCPYDRWQLNRAVMHRMLFDDTAWNIWKPRLLQVGGVSSAIIEEAEGTEFIEEGISLRSRMKKTDKDFFAYFEKMEKAER